MMYLDYVDKPRKLISVFSNIYLLIPTLLVEITIRVPWFAERSNISSLGDFHGYIFIF